MDVLRSIEEMAAAVRSGQFTQAQQLGAAAAVPLALQPEELRVAAPLGTGGQGAVHHGSLHGQPVAVKLPRLHGHEDMLRFRLELATLAALRGCPGVVQLRGACCLPPRYCLAMEIGGPSLAELIYEHTPVWRPSWRQLLSVGVQLARALAAVHDAGIVHRDIKPRNVLVSAVSSTAAGSPASSEGTCSDLLSRASLQADVPIRVQLCDFGVARATQFEEHLKQSQAATASCAPSSRAAPMRKLHGSGPTGGFKKAAMVGTQEYMAPELLMASAPHSPASDVYALAVTLAELATGLPPFSDACRGADAPQLHTALEMGYGKQELAAAVVCGLRPSLPTLAPGTHLLAEVLGACWSEDPAARPSAAQVAEALEAIVRELADQKVDQAVDCAGHDQDQHMELQHLSGSLQDLAAMAHDAAEPSSDSGASDMDVATLGDVQLPRLVHANSFGSTMSGDTPDCSRPGTPSLRACASPGLGYSSPTSFSRISSVLSLAGSALASHSSHRTATHELLHFGPPACSKVDAAASSAAASVQLSSGVCVVVTAGACAAQGPREAQEDAHVVAVGPEMDQGVLGSLEHQVLQSSGAGQTRSAASSAAPSMETSSASAAPTGHVAVLAVFDGHRGSGASQFCASRAQQEVEVQLAAVIAAGGEAAASPAVALSMALRRAVVALEEEYHTLWMDALRTAAMRGTPQRAAMPGASQAGACPGSTVLLAVVWCGLLGVANTGDCRAVLWRQGQPLMLTADHNTQSCAERARVAAAGGAVVQHNGTGGWRLAGAGLQATRALGDFDLKAQSRGLVVEPDVTITQIQEGDEWVLLGSDGLFEGLTPNTLPGSVPEGLQGAAADQAEAALAAARAHAAGQTAGALVASTVRHPAMVSRRLVEESLFRGSQDNVTAVLAYLQPVTTLTRVF